MNEPERTVERLLLTKKEAAKLLGIGVRMLEILVSRKAIAVVRIGPRCVRFQPKDIEAYVSRHVHKAIGQ